MKDELIIKFCEKNNIPYKVLELVKLPDYWDVIGYPKLQNNKNDEQNVTN